jgi:hypothetical protein
MVFVGAERKAEVVDEVARASMCWMVLEGGWRRV